MITVTCKECGSQVEGLLDFENHMRAHEDECDACGGKFSTTSDPMVKAECDSGIADHPFEAPRFDMAPEDMTFCDVCGWKKIEHDLDRDLRVHESCFLDNDDILVRA